jgi:hypothetical protein
MGWIKTFQASAEAQRADPSDATVINGAPYDAHPEIRNSAENPAASVDRAGAQVSEEIRRRQLWLLERYVAAVRVH